MKTIFLLIHPFAALILCACAHLPSDSEKAALRAEQQDVKKIESALYGKDSLAGLFEQLKMCSLQLHDRVNPAEVFDWSESIDKHSDKDFFSEDDRDVSRAEYNLLVAEYKIYKQYSSAKKDLYEHRLKSCQGDLKAVIRREKIQSEQEQAFLDKLNESKAEHTKAVVPAAPISTLAPSLVPAGAPLITAPPATPAVTPAVATPVSPIPVAPPAPKAAPTAANAEPKKAVHEEVSLPPPMPLEPAQVGPARIPATTKQKSLEDEL